MGRWWRIGSARDAEALRLTGDYPANAPAVLEAFAAAAPSPMPSTPAAPPPTPAAPPPPSSMADATATDVHYPGGLEWLDPSTPRGNSNAWAVAPSRTGTGPPSCSIP